MRSKTRNLETFLWYSYSIVCFVTRREKPAPLAWLSAYVMQFSVFFLTADMTEKSQKHWMCNSNIYFHKLVHKIKIKCISNLTRVPTCFGVLNTPSSGERTEHFPWRWCVKHIETYRDFCEGLYTFYFNFMYELVKIHVVVIVRTRNGQF
jgi:hypothetical protein